MPMEYGNEKDWEEHFQYLLSFFKDQRYEKKDNMPLFMIFESDEKVLEDIFCYFNQRCIENGFNGIFLIETYFGRNSSENNVPKNHFSQTKSIHYREPAYSKSLYDNMVKGTPEMLWRKNQRALVKLKLSHRPQIYENDRLFECKINDKSIAENIIYGVTFEWDNTPRHHERGYVINPVSKEKFMAYMSKIHDVEYLFINAWNEWCEGMILEPTKQDGYKYLEWLKEWAETQS